MSRNIASITSFNLAFGHFQEVSEVSAPTSKCDQSCFSTDPMLDSNSRSSVIVLAVREK